MMGERNKIRLALAGVFLIAIFAVIIDIPAQIESLGFTLPEWLYYPFHLGLDLQGGTQLIYEADLSEIPAADHASAVEGVRDVIERRVNAFGVAEPIIQTTQTEGKYRIIVELAGISDVNQAIEMIGETPLLEFKEANPNPQVQLTQEQQQQLNEYNENAKTRAEEILAELSEIGADFSAIAQAKSEDDGSAPNGGDLGFAVRGAFVKEFEDVCFDELAVGETKRELVRSDFGYHIIKKTDEHGSGDEYEARCSHILVLTKSPADVGTPADQWLYTGLTGKQLERAAVEFDQNTQMPHVALTFNDEGKELFAVLTEKNIGKPVAIFLDGMPISIPTVQDAIKNGSAIINGQFTIQEAKLLAQRLNAGALPVPINMISQQTVGASLGNESTQKSFEAGILGFLLICAFIILIYRLPGIIAVLALIFYGLVVLAIFKLIPVTLTLSGIAGFILSIGMAVDANVLIFERFKEEIRNGKALPIALDEGFKRAWSAIFDGNMSTLITCLILIGFTTSMVKGFAVTLSIGILCSMLSAVVVTRVFLKQIIRVKALNSHWLFGVKKVFKD